MSTKYPKWFNAHFPPGYKPTPPPEMIWEYKAVETLTASPYDHIDFTTIPECTNCLTVNVEKDYYDSSVTGVEIIFSQKTQIPNPNYAKLKEDYDKRLLEYKVQMKEWRQLKKVWDEEQGNKGKEDRLKLFEKLKKEFGDV